MTRVLLPLLLATGCAPTVSYQDVRVSRATLQDADTSSIAVIGGYVGGDALLVFSGPGGVSGAMPVALRGGRAGLALDINLDLNPGSDIPLDLSEAGGTVWLSEILGRYRGLGWALSAGLGGSGRSLKNSAGIRIKDRHFSLGGGAFVGMEWMTIRIGGHEDDIDNIGFQWPIDTGYPGDTGLYDTGLYDTGLDDSGYPAVSGGCGGSTSASPQDTATPSSSGGCSGGSSSADTSADDTGADDASGGCGSSSTSSDTAGDADDAGSSEDDDDDGGGCGSSSSDTGTAFYGALILSVVGLRRRHRREARQR